MLSNNIFLEYQYLKLKINYRYLGYIADIPSQESYCIQPLLYVFQKRVWIILKSVCYWNFYMNYISTRYVFHDNVASSSGANLISNNILRSNIHIYGNPNRTIKHIMDPILESDWSFINWTKNWGATCWNIKIWCRPTM